MLIDFQHCQGFEQFVIKSIATFCEYQRICTEQPIDRSTGW